MTIPSVVEAAAALAESRALPNVVREMLRQLLERIAELEAQVERLEDDLGIEQREIGAQEVADYREQSAQDHQDEMAQAAWEEDHR